MSERIIVSVISKQRENLNSFYYEKNLQFKKKSPVIKNYIYDFDTVKIS